MPYITALKKAVLARKMKSAVDFWGVLDFRLISWLMWELTQRC
ncbi:hypothetical protein HAINFHK1212_1147 [Haemophilus influenzae HK1212]|uniref:Uncharacterized protein n=1 Tax=Haemophilus influenzae HK1212 TaxID=456482 RepID=A0A7G2JZK9_HAEIF|nr:hypothetical protein HAINFHK1212_1147 [Haemophilus influenzae HK1212]